MIIVARRRRDTLVVLRDFNRCLRARGVGVVDEFVRGGGVKNLYARRGAAREGFRLLASARVTALLIPYKGEGRGAIRGHSRFVVVRFAVRWNGLFRCQRVVAGCEVFLVGVGMHRPFYLCREALDEDGASDCRPRWDYFAAAVASFRVGAIAAFSNGLGEEEPREVFSVQVVRA